MPEFPKPLPWPTIKNKDYHGISNNAISSNAIIVTFQQINLILYTSFFAFLKTIRTVQWIFGECINQPVSTDCTSSLVIYKKLYKYIFLPLVYHFLNFTPNNLFFVISLLWLWPIERRSGIMPLTEKGYAWCCMFYLFPQLSVDALEDCSFVAKKNIDWWMLLLVASTLLLTTQSKKEMARRFSCGVMPQRIADAMYFAVARKRKVFKILIMYL